MLRQTKSYAKACVCLKSRKNFANIKHQALKREVSLGVTQIEQGEGLVYNSSTELADEIKSEARNLQRARGNP
jgi:hypothetical protein